MQALASCLVLPAGLRILAEPVLRHSACQKQQLEPGCRAPCWLAAVQNRARHVQRPWGRGASTSQCRAGRRAGARGGLRGRRGRNAGRRRRRGGGRRRRLHGRAARRGGRLQAARRCRRHGHAQRPGAYDASHMLCLPCPRAQLFISQKALWDDFCLHVSTNLLVAVCAVLAEQLARLARRAGRSALLHRPPDPAAAPLWRRAALRRR